MDYAIGACCAAAEPAAAVEVFTPLADAVAEIQRRRANTHLRQQVEAFLGGDIPEYLRGPQPVLLLDRHVATPNLETLRFVELATPFGLPMVISQDSQDKFVAHNGMKRALGRLPLQTGRRIDYRCIIDVNAAQGARLCDIHTLAGIPLVGFHNDWLRRALPTQVQVADDAELISRQQRGNLPERYKRFLALLVAHEVLLENYEAEDTPLLRAVIEPAFVFAEQRFGVRPLIANLAAGVVPPPDWNAYPEHIHHQLDRLQQGAA